MDAVIGITTNQFTLIASDTTINTSSLLLHSDESKIDNIANTIIAYAGEQADAFRLLSLAKEDSIYIALRYNTLVTPKLVTNIIQKDIHTSLRKSPKNTEWLVGGGKHDFELYMVDVYGARLFGKYFCLGSARYFGYGRLDELYKENMSVEDAIGIVRDVGSVLKKRFIKRFDKFNVKIVSNDGVTDRVVTIE